MIYRGTCWKFGDDIGIDTHIMPLKYTLQRLSDPEELKPHVFEEVDPEFAGKVRPGDLIVSGRRFAQGNPHLQAFLGIRGLGMGVLTDSMPRGAIRIAVFAGVPILPFCKDVTAQVENGDDLEVDFETGRLRNLTRGIEFQYEPLVKEILDIIRAGGTKGFLKQTLAKGTTLA